MNENKRVIIDYLSATFPLIISEIEDEQERSIRTFRLFRDYFGLHNSQCRHEPFANNNFKYQYTFSDYITLRCAGPYNSNGERTCQFEMKGEGCREFERIANGKTWLDLFKLLYGMDVTFKRIDITIDDLSGMEINQKYLYKKLRKGEYTSAFKSAPKYHGLIDEGFTIELGSRRSTNQLVIYDKKSEQIQRHKICDEDYWCRYEMRFREGKADVIVLDLCKNYVCNDDLIYGIDIRKFAKSELYNLLDIKKENKDDSNHLYRNETDPKWLAFLDNSEKAKLPKVEERQTTYETRRVFAMPKAAVVIGTWYAMCNRNMELFIHDFLKEMFSIFSKFNIKQKKRLNQCLIDNGIDPYDEKEFERFKMEFFEKYIEMELPF